VDSDAVVWDMDGTPVDTARPYPGVIDALTALRSSIPMVVFTGASPRAADILLTASGLRDFFAVVVGGDQIARPKPASDGILRACELIGVSPERCLYVGDAPTDLQAATAARPKGVAAGWGHLFRPADGTLIAKTPADAVDLIHTLYTDTHREGADTLTPRQRTHHGLQLRCSGSVQDPPR
jgi:beta-phosphoglucomutase-like phosphatase (HAD superfamily)